MAVKTLVDAVNSVLGAIGNIPYDWGAVKKSRQAYLFQYVAMFNDQINRAATGDIDPYDCPACFLEIIPADSLRLLGGISTSDFIYRVRIVGVEFDAKNGTKDQNLTIFAYRDVIKATLAYFTPDNSSRLQHVAESQDTDHTAVYVWQMDFKSAFIDTKGSIYDPTIADVIEFYSPNITLEERFSVANDNVLQDENLTGLTDEFGQLIEL